MNNLQRGADITFLALTIWREARGEPIEAQIGVGYTVLNRAARPGWWGRSVTGCLFQKWQYSSLTDPHDRQLTTWPHQDDSSWGACLAVASQVYDGAVANPVPGADSYYDDSIRPPTWTAKARLVGKLGRLNFYDVDHDYEVSPL